MERVPGGAWGLSGSPVSPSLGHPPHSPPPILGPLPTVWNLPYPPSLGPPPESGASPSQSRTSPHSLEPPRSGTSPPSLGAVSTSGATQRPPCSGRDNGVIPTEDSRIPSQGPWVRVSGLPPIMHLANIHPGRRPGLLRNLGPASPRGAGWTSQLRLRGLSSAVAGMWGVDSRGESASRPFVRRQPGL